MAGKPITRSCWPSAGRALDGGKYGGNSLQLGRSRTYAKLVPAAPGRDSVGADLQFLEGSESKTFRRICAGAELRQGCLIPNVRGLCQLSNAAVTILRSSADLKIVERTRHTLPYPVRRGAGPRRHHLLELSDCACAPNRACCLRTPLQGRTGVLLLGKQSLVQIYEQRPTARQSIR